MRNSWHTHGHTRRSLPLPTNGSNANKDWERVVYDRYNAYNVQLVMASDYRRWNQAIYELPRLVLLSMRYGRSLKLPVTVIGFRKNLDEKYRWLQRKLD